MAVHPLIQHIRKYVSIDEESTEDILHFFETIELKKKQNILTEGQICKANYFVVKGCLRMFFIKENGVEQTMQFGLENWWITDNFSLLSQQSSAFYIQAVEKSAILAIGNESFKKLLEQFPFVESYFRIMYQRAYAALQNRTIYQYSFSKEALFAQFSSMFPAFVNRIPQYLLASYLGITPEYLSELRKKRIS